MRPQKNIVDDDPIITKFPSKDRIATGNKRETLQESKRVYVGNYPE